MIIFAYPNEKKYIQNCFKISVQQTCNAFLLHVQDIAHKFKLNSGIFNHHHQSIIKINYSGFIAPYSGFIVPYNDFIVPPTIIRHYKVSMLRACSTLIMHYKVAFIVSYSCMYIIRQHYNPVLVYSTL